MRWWLPLAALVVGCDRPPPGDTVGSHETGTPDDTGTPTTDTETTTTDPTACVSGTTWTGGDRESPLMHPGGDCIGCHTSRNEGPNLVIAGTVYSRLHEPDDCNGRSGVVVEITGADDQVFEATTNAAGNFFLYATTPLVLPYTARVRGTSESQEPATTVSATATSSATLTDPIPTHTGATGVG
ncbi:MAG: hypothetical protein H6738_09670 [Alphaproteobacteria bacterium]|nr:hypothetical protein [Alphaproteobacteria bacterium]MCB9697033.1 hypothetical protein [Alphaproteobacteria bacterium]